MARVKITEYRAKKLLLGDAYQGVPVTDEVPKLVPGKYVVKVDQGVKKRYKKGLLFLDQSEKDVPKALQKLAEKGYSRFLVEPVMAHDVADEQYLSLERVRDGIRVLEATEGGIDIEEHPEKVNNYLYDEKKANAFLKYAVQVFEEQHFAFLEINPLVKGIPLDAAVMVDSAASFFVKGWSEADIVNARHADAAEEAIEALQKTSPASLKLTVLSTDAPLWFLLSGGGGSIVVLDEVAAAGGGAMIGNYGEYSGGPTREETYLYAKEVIGLLLASKAKKKALVIAGGVANFTDVGQTFAGIIDAMEERAADLKKQRILVYVRRGGPHEDEGLANMKEFLERSGILGAVYGSGTVITKAASDAVRSTT